VAGPRRKLSVFVLVAGLLVAATSALEPSEDGSAVNAVFEGQPIDLTQDWGEAQACLYWPEATNLVECFRSEAEMDRRLGELRAEQNPVAVKLSFGGAAAASTCSGYVRLYDGTGYGTPVLYLAGRFQWINLSPFGWDQRTSSYKIGPCSAYFADYTNGGGAWYPTSLTQAYDQASSMISGWNNDVSSVYIT